MTEEKKPKKGDKTAACDQLGIDALCDRIVSGESQRAIAESIGVSIATLSNWIGADLERSARAREARITAAGSYAEKAESVLDDAQDPFMLAKARELASHYRWMASKGDPRRFGDKLEVEQHTTISELSEEQIDAKLARLIEQSRKA